MQGEYHGNMKADIGVMFLQAEGCQRLLATHQKPGETHETDSP